jgi:peptidoglycan/LPS O-acetylase OafA/YrhL
MEEPRASNSYDFVRFCAASAVLFSHHFALSRIPEPPVPGYGEDFGKLAVEIFFCLSGFLICRSLQKSANWALFFSSRFLRIFPNLAFSLTVTSIATLLWYHNYSHLWKHAKFVIGNLLMFFRGVTYVIPGVFEDAKGGAAVNGPLWSLPYEVWLYICLFLCFVIGGRRAGSLVVVAVVSFTLVWSAVSLFGGFAIGPFDGFQFARLGSYFFSGAVLAGCWPFIGKHAIAIGTLGLLVIICSPSFLQETILHSLALAAIVIGLGSSNAMAWFARGGDASYGMYIFAWPLQTFSLLFINSFWLSMLAAFLATTAVGYATWHSFEKRAMSSRRQLAERLQKWTVRLVKRGPSS